MTGSSRFANLVVDQGVSERNTGGFTVLGSLILNAGMPIGVALFLGGGGLLVWSVRRAHRD